MDIRARIERWLTDWLLGMPLRVASSQAWWRDGRWTSALIWATGSQSSAFRNWDLSTLQNSFCHQILAEPLGSQGNTAFRTSPKAYFTLRFELSSLILQSPTCHLRGFLPFFFSQKPYSPIGSNPLQANRRSLETAGTPSLSRHSSPHPKNRSANSPHAA